jgi:hypothetical protein
MTDIDIVKALECCNKPVGKNSCEDCPFHHSQGRCTENMLTNALNLLNRQQAEIERLKARDERRKKLNYDEGIKQLKAEAIKEVEVKIHEKLHQAEMHGNFEPVVTREMFDSVVKELVGEQK